MFKCLNQNLPAYGMLMFYVIILFIMFFFTYNGFYSYNQHTAMAQIGNFEKIPKASPRKSPLKNYS